MKWNWGTGLVVGMVCFMCFILYFVIKITTNKEFSHDLVTEDYYAKEMAYQKEIDAETNTKNLSVKVESKKTSEGWLITFPKSFNNLKGKAFLYRPSNKKLDFEMPLQLKANTFLIPNKNLIDGRWNIILEWSSNGKPYMYKENIVF